MEGAVGPFRQVGLDSGDREVPDLSVVHHQLAALVDLLDLEGLEVVDDDKVTQIAGGDSAPVVQQEIPGGVVTGHLHSGDGVCAQSDGPLDDIVDVTLFQQIAGVLVVGAEHAPLGILVAQQGEQRIQVPGGGALPDHDELAPLQLGDGVVQVMALMVGVDAGGDVGVEVVAHQIGGVAVDLLLMAWAATIFSTTLLVSGNGAYKVHHLR